MKLMTGFLLGGNLKIQLPGSGRIDFNALRAAREILK